MQALKIIGWKLLSKERVIVVALAAMVILLFNIAQRPPESDEQLEYRGWLHSINSARNVSPENRIIVSLHLDGRITKSFSVTDAQSEERVIRLLDLLQEAKVFNRSFSESDEFRVRIERGEPIFRASFRESELGENMPLRNFIKLVELFPPS